MNKAPCAVSLSAALVTVSGWTVDVSTKILPEMELVDSAASTSSSRTLSFEIWDTSVRECWRVKEGS